MSLSTKTKKISFIVSLRGISEGEYSSLSDKLKNWLGSDSEQYAFILHERDCLDDGTFKTPHFHCVADMKSARRLSTFLGDIALALGVNPLAVSIEKYVSFESYLQYLVHKNDTDKFQYPESKIVTNIPADAFRIYMDCDCTRDDYGKILDACYSCNNLKEVISTLGLKFFTQYHRAIQITWDCVRSEKYRGKH